MPDDKTLLVRFFFFFSAGQSEGKAHYNCISPSQPHRLTKAVTCQGDPHPMQDKQAVLPSLPLAC